MSAESSRSGATWMLTHGGRRIPAPVALWVAPENDSRISELTSFCNWLWKCPPRSNGTFAARNAGHPASQWFLTFRR